MVKHVILWQFNDELSAEEKEQLKADIKKRLEALVGVVPGLREVIVETDPLETSNADWLLDCTLDDEDSLKGYAVHPAHVAVAKELILPNSKTRVCMDYEV